MALDEKLTSRSLSSAADGGSITTREQLPWLPVPRTEIFESAIEAA